MTTTDTDDVKQLRAAQTMLVEHDHDRVALRLASDDDVRVYVMSRDGFARLAKALTDDARRLSSH
jgi:23S rRNA A2030 N6-methylase RlmJ